MIAALAALQPHLARVQAVMTAALASPEPRVQSLIDELGGFHGKMLRPSLCLLMAEATGGVEDGHLTIGAALELIHTATLVHDDLIDDADTRRGKATAHTRFGNTTAILIGDYLYTHAFHTVARLGEPRIMERLTATTNIVCRGELHQQVAERQGDLSEAEYERIVYGKTAALTELAGESGAWGRDPRFAAAGAAYGRACGIAFQIVDDCLDLAGDAQKVGKTLATDLERGRVTLPIIRALATTPASERAAAERLLLHAGDPAEVARARDYVIDRGGLRSAIATARDRVAEAKRALAPLPPSPATAHLHDLADFIVARDF